MYDLYFTHEDLAANKRGELSAQQKERIDSFLLSGQASQQQRGIDWLAILAVGFFMLGVVVTIIELLTARQGIQYGRSLYGGSLVVFGGMLTVILVVWVPVNWLNNYALRSGQIRTIEGKVWAGTRTVGNRLLFTYVVDVQGRERKTFIFPDASSLDMFENGQSYRLYYIAYSPVPVVLSAEAIPPAGSPFAGDGRKTKE